MCVLIEPWLQPCFCSSPEDSWEGVNEEAWDATQLLDLMTSLPMIHVVIHRVPLYFMTHPGFVCPVIDTEYVCVHTCSVSVVFAIFCTNAIK